MRKREEERTKWLLEKCNDEPQFFMSKYKEKNTKQHSILPNFKSKVLKNIKIYLENKAENKYDTKASNTYEGTGWYVYITQTHTHTHCYKHRNHVWISNFLSFLII